MIEIVEQFGPLIIMFISIFQLFNKQNYLFFYIIGISLNTIINLLLKYIIKQPRPLQPNKIMEIAEKHGYDYLYSIDKYGMPSGHAQNLGFSFGFMYPFIKKSFILTLFYLLFSFSVLFLRHESFRHTLLQLCIGFLFGVILGVIFFYLSSHHIKGNLNKKQDDYSFYN